MPRWLLVVMVLAGSFLLVSSVILGWQPQRPGPAESPDPPAVSRP